MNADTTSHPERIANDEAYTWGRGPSTYLAERQVVRLTILRSHLAECDLRNRVVTPAE
jgi:hypothetical protein